MHSAVHLRLFTVGDIGSDGFRMTFDGFGGYLQACQQFHLLTPTVEAGIAAHSRHHAPHARGVFGSQHVQFRVARGLSLMAIRTNVIVAVKANPP